jgi:hypothetical protein
MSQPNISTLESRARQKEPTKKPGVLSLTIVSKKPKHLAAPRITNQNRERFPERYHLHSRE